MRQGRQPFRVGAWNVDPASGEIACGDRRVTLPPRAMDVLCHLAARPRVIASPNELLDAVWGDAEVAPGAVYQTVLQLRRALGDDAGAPTIIENVPRRGYRLIAPVTTVSATTPAADPADDPDVTAAAPASTRLPGPGERAPQPRAAGSAPRRRAFRGGIAAVATGVVLLVVAFVLGTRGTAPDARDSGSAAALPAIAVLPLRSAAGAQNADYLADGITEELIITLGQLPGLSVIGRSSSLQLRGTNASAQDVGARFGVRYVLEGRVLTRDARVRVDVALVSARTGTQLWSETYDASVATLPGVQEDVARAVARALNLLLSPSDSERLARRARRDPQAYEIYLRGRYQWNRRDAESLLAARALFDQAALRDPDDADARVALAEVDAVLPLYGAAPPHTAFPRARRAAEEALAIDAGRGEARAVLAVVAYQYEHDWPRAESEFRAALAASPRHATALQWYSEFLSYAQRFEDAERMIAAARAVDPASPTIAVLAGSPALWARDCKRAAAAYREALRRLGDFPLAWYSLGLAQLCAGDPLGARDALQRASTALGPSFVAPALAHAQIRLGERSAARELLAAMLAERNRRYVSQYKIAVLNAALGERDAALSALELAERESDDRLVLLRVDPLLDDLRSEPRFAALVARLRIPGSRDVPSAR